MRWYALSVWGGAEKQIKYDIEQIAKVLNLEDKIGRVLLPYRTVSRRIRGKEIQQDDRILSGYMLVQLEMDPRVFSAIRCLSGVLNFLGDEVPNIVDPRDIEGTLDSMFGEIEDEKDNIVKGDMVLVHTQDGSILMRGILCKIDGEDVTVDVKMLGRETSVRTKIDRLTKIEPE